MGQEFQKGYNLKMAKNTITKNEPFATRVVLELPKKIVDLQDGMDLETVRING